MLPGDRSELVPLRTDFDVVWRGYDQDQVRYYVESVEEELRLLLGDRDAAIARADALATQLEALRTDNRELRAQIDRICRTPIDKEALSERLQHMIELTHAEAAEITHRAEATAEQTWAAAREAATQLRRRYERMFTDLEARRRDMEAEHRELITKARSRVETMIADAETRRRQLDEQADRHRQQVEQDFDIAMSQRRATAQRELDEQTAAAQADAERVCTQAREQAQRLVADAEREVEALHRVRDRAVRRIRAARKALDAAAPLLKPERDRPLLKPEPDRSVPAA